MNVRNKMVGRQQGGLKKGLVENNDNIYKDSEAKYEILSIKYCH